MITKHPDIIFIVLDTQRADRLGCYGYGKAVTPNLDRFAEQSTVFAQAISPAQWTIPSHASMFTGLYPTTHQVTQASQSLSPSMPHLVELLQSADYQTVGFCNNPLVGILDNGFKRGFKTFYNYGGAIPSVPSSSTKVPWPLKRLSEGYTQMLRRISYPIQNFFGRSDLAFRISLNAWLTPLWSRFANFKGQNARSVRDISRFLQQRDMEEAKRPLFLFLNLMETHLPFTPPAKQIDKVAPYFRHNRAARELMNKWNREAYRWAAPLAAPLGELESRVLNDMYDAEVAYQDDYLQQLFETLENRHNRDNTLTIIVGDHGDGLGDHGFMGHAFVAYQELVHVPLIINWPRRLPKAGRVYTPVSTRRVFHTMLEAVDPLPEKMQVDPVQVRNLTLIYSAQGRDPEQGTAYSEVYAPLTFVKAIEKRQPELLARHRCLSTRRAVVKFDAENTFKLIDIDGQAGELFNLTSDTLELENIYPSAPQNAERLDRDLKRITAAVDAQKAGYVVGDAVEMDDALVQRLRGLGYLD